ncbi:MAG: hypothetical protein FWD43_05435 [Coriobacteriia bacterium]|nr:hypothetical protein [Coriobacteriia bacterium]
MKKQACFVLILAIMISLLFPLANAYADVVYEPQDDFFNSHRDACISIDRWFYVNGEEGYAIMMVAPNSNKEVDVLRNGTELYISYTYDQRGVIWGLTEFQSSITGKRVSAWLPWDKLVLKYDHISFEQDHGSEFYIYTGDLGFLKEVERIYVWDWPGADGQPWSTTPGNLQVEDPQFYIEMEKTYKDEMGREWCFFDYRYASWGKWVCISDPSNGEIPAFNSAPDPKLVPPAETLPVPKGFNLLLLIIILVVVVVIVAAILILVFWRRSQPANASTRTRRQ